MVESLGGFRDRRRLMLRMLFSDRIPGSASNLIYMSCSLIFSRRQPYSVGLTYPELKTKLL